MKQKTYPEITLIEKDRIVEMAWEDKTTFDAIFLQFGLTETAVIKLMRSEMKASSFNMWRKRVCGRKTKHTKRIDGCILLFKSRMQNQISMNKISKR